MFLMTIYNCQFNGLIAFSDSSDDDDDEDEDDDEDDDDDETEEEVNEDDDDDDDDDEDEDDEGMLDDEEDEDDDFAMKMTEEVNFVGKQVHVWRFKIIVECVLTTRHEILINPISSYGARR
jgi:Cobalamin biosynthesis protein CobT (nicotinate-mononucleotide:5, 6-dimethylbenzimidazole phosphoribosyltransferase)